MAKTSRCYGYVRNSSPGNARKQRPALMKLLQSNRSSKPDIVVVEDMSRLARRRLPDPIED